jgi:hypothetical protein
VEFRLGCAPVGFENPTTNCFCGAADDVVDELALAADVDDAAGADADDDEELLLPQAAARTPSATTHGASAPRTSLRRFDCIRSSLLSPHVRNVRDVLRVQGRPPWPLG